MKFRFLPVIAAGFLMAGCSAPEPLPGEGTPTKEEVPMPVIDGPQIPFEGPAGGGKLDKTSPNMPAGNSLDGNSGSAFPSTVQPAAPSGQ